MIKFFFSDDQDKADILNTFFTAQTILDDSGASLPSVTPRGDFSLISISLLPYEVESTFKSMKVGKASGPDQINNRILKELEHPLSFPPCDLFNYSFSCGKIPKIWKQANLTPIFKKGDQFEVSNYRPISLLCTIGKAIEKLVHKYVFNFFMERHVITTFQSGFTAGDSTVNQIVDVYNTFCRALDEGKEVKAIFFFTLVKLLIGSGIRVFYSNCNLLVSPVLFWNGLQTIFLRESSVLFFQVCLQTGQLVKKAYPKALSWGRYSF